MFNSIRWRIAIPFVLLILLTMLGLGVYISNFMRQTYLQNLEAELTAEARLVADILATSSILNSDPDSIDSLTKHWSTLLGTRVTVVAADGTVIGESHDDRLQMENHLNRPEIKEAAFSGQGTSSRFSRTVGYEMLYTAVPVIDNGQVSGYVRISLPLQQIQANLSELQSTLTGVTVVVSVLAVILAAWIASRTTKPIRLLTEAAGKISSGEQGGRIIPDSSDEVGRLTQAFNLMSVQLLSQIQALESERSKIFAVLQFMTDGVLIVDSQGKVQLINPAAQQIFEISEPNVVGHSLVEVLRDHQLVELWQRCRSTGDSQVATFEVGPKRLYLQGIATPLGQALPGNTLLLFQNLTRLRHLETVRRDFISNISHELRTPLASLKALTETLQEGALDDPTMAQHFLQKIEIEVDALSMMVSELLELSRIESGRVPLQFKPTEPTHLLTQAVDRLRLQAQRAGLEVTVNCPDDLPLVMADPNRLEQVIVNLLHNAIKFTPANGVVIVQAERKADHILFSVADTGVGIPADDLPRIFERFFKSDRARSSGGTGLGLAIARHTVEAHGGRIWAESRESKGSVFYFSIPIAGSVFDQRAKESHHTNLE